jgi:molecular chaperone HtpG
MEQILRAMGQEVPEIKRILEINPDHNIFDTLKGLYARDELHQRLKEYSELLYDQAVLAEGGTIEDPAEFGRRLADLMVRSVESE